MILRTLSGMTEAVWDVLLDASFYILIGLSVAGLIHAFLRTETIQKYLSRGRIRSVFYAALMGIPLPLCSCGVIPAAIQLRRAGANKGAATAFFISTPETGVDSIALTYGLIDPAFAFIRPAAAFITATSAGLIENFIEPDNAEFLGAPPLDQDQACGTENGSCYCKEEEKASSKEPLLRRLKRGLIYGWSELIDDIAPSFTVGIILAGLIAYFIPTTLIEQYLSGGLSSMLLMLLVGLPLYVCASASTPIAASFIAKGMSPGTALVFLLAGPASNIASATVIGRFLGKRAVVVHLVTIAVMAVLFGLAVDALYKVWEVDLQVVAGETSEALPLWVRQTTAVILILLLAKGIVRRFIKKSACRET